MHKFSVFFIVGLFAINVQGRGVPFIDEEFKHYDQKGDTNADECIQKYKNPIDATSCIDDALNQRYQRSEIPARGTWDYCDHKYKPMSEDELKKLHLKLKTQQTTARGNSDISGHRLPGELTKEHFQTEIACIETYLSQRRDQRNARGLDKIRNGGRWGK